MIFFEFEGYFFKIRFSKHYLRSNQLEKISKLNNNIIMVLAISSILFFLYSFNYSYSINNENNEIKDNEEFDYIFDPGEYIASEDTIEENGNIDSEKNPNNLIKTFDKDEQNNDNSYYNNILIDKSEDNITDYNFVAAGDWYVTKKQRRQ